MKIILISIFISLLLFPPQTKLVKINIAGDIIVSIPESFTVMTPEDVNQRYKSYRKPIALYTDPSRLVDFGVNFAFSKWAVGDLEILGKFYKSSLLNLYTEVEFINEGMKSINGKEYVHFEFISTISSTEDNSMVILKPIKKYTQLLYTVDKGRTIIFNFSCPADQQLLWQSDASRIMASVNIKN